MPFYQIPLVYCIYRLYNSSSLKGKLNDEKGELFKQ
jgi:hypothetical protein